MLAILSRRQQATFYSQRKREIAVFCGIKKVPQPLKNNFAGVNKEEGVNDLKNFSRSRQHTILKNQLVFVQPNLSTTHPKGLLMMLKITHQRICLIFPLSNFPNENMLVFKL